MKKTIMILAALAAFVAAGRAQIGSLPYMQGFEGGLDQWTTVDLDGDGQNWTVNSNSQYNYVHTGSKSAVSRSLSSSWDAIEPDNWLISPALQVDDESVVVEFWYRNMYEGGEEHFGLFVVYGTDAGDLDWHEPVWETTLEGDYAWHKAVVSLAEWVGQDVYVALRHYDVSGEGALLIDDITIRQAYVPVVELQGMSTVGVGATVAFEAVLQEGFTSGLSYQWTSVMADAGNATMNYDDATMSITYSTVGTDTVRVVVSNGYGADTATMVVNAADAVVSFPYSTGFEAGDDTSWLFYGGTNSWYIGQAASYDGSRSLYISNNGGADNQYTFSGFSTGQASYAARLLTVTQAGDYRVGFNWRCQGEVSDYLRAFIAPSSVVFEANVTNGIGSTNTPAGWVSIDGGSRRYQQSTWQRQESSVTLAEGTYWLVFVWRNDYSEGNNPPAAVDSVTMWLYDCTAPVDLVRQEVSSNSITIGWTPAGIASQWIVSVDGGAWQQVLTPMYTANGLVPGTSHTFTVRSLCTDFDTSIAVSATFTTMCSTVTEYPWYEDFGSLNVMHCWDAVSMDGDANTWRRDDGALRISAVADSSDDWAITRPFAIPLTSEGLALHYDVCTGNYIYGEASYELRVNVMGNYVIDDFDELLLSETCNGPWVRRTVDLSAFAGQTVSLAFRKVGLGNGELAIDNMSISIDTPRVEIAGAPIVDVEEEAVFRVTVLEGATQEMTYTWSTTLTADISPDADSVNIVWHAAGEDTVRLVATSMLGSDTAWFAVTVRDLDPAELPYFTGFEVGDDCNWQRIKDGFNAWVIDTAAHFSGARALYISADSGLTNTYADSLSTYAAAYRVMNVTEAGSYMVSYNWRAEGEDGGYQQNDYMRVFLMPAAQELVIGYNGQITASSLPAGSMPLDGGSQLNRKAEWQSRTEVLDIEEAGLYRLVFYWRNDGSVGTNPAAAVDNVGFSLISCWAPTEMAVDDVTDSGATISWQRRGDAGEWEVKVGNNAPVVVYDTFYTVGGLDAAVDYAVSIRSICGNGDTSFSLTGTFRTECSLVEVPYTQDFNSGEARCWTILDYNSTSGMTGIAQPPLLGASLALRLKAGTVLQPVFAITPEVSLADVRSVSFKALGASLVNLRIGVMTDPQDTSTFTLLGTIDSIESYSTWTDYSVNFEGNTLPQGYVAFRAGVRAEDNYSVFLDEVKVDTAAYIPPVIDTTSTDTIVPVPPVDTTTIDTTGIVMAQSIEVALQPNPATAEVRVVTVGPAEVSLIDMQGRTVGRWRTESGDCMLAVGTLPRGTYFVRTTGQYGTAVRKLLLR